MFIISSSWKQIVPPTLLFNGRNVINFLSLVLLEQLSEVRLHFWIIDLYVIKILKYIKCIFKYFINNLVPNISSYSDFKKLFLVSNSFNQYLTTLNFGSVWRGLLRHDLSPRHNLSPGWQIVQRRLHDLSPERGWQIVQRVCIFFFLLTNRADITARFVTQESKK